MENFKKNYLMVTNRSRMLVVISVYVRLKVCYRLPIYYLSLSVFLSL